AAEIEPGNLPRMRMAHDLPIHEVVGSDDPRSLGSSAIGWQDSVTEEKAQHAAHRAAVLDDRDDRAIVSECLLHCPEISLWQDGCTQISITGSIDFIETVDVAIDLARQIELDAFSDHRALLAGNRQHRLVEIAFDLAPERYIEIGTHLPHLVGFVRAAK